jgi:pimeloyl-ACP methyl ester carboxylesterase
MCSKAPGYFHQYIGIGQVGDWLKGERASYDFVLGKARLCGDRALAKRLERNGPPPYKKTARLMAQRGALLRCGGSLYGKTSYRHLQPYYVGAQGYSLPDAARAALGLRDSLKALWGECQALKLNDIAGRLEVPVHIIAGRHDMQVPAAVAKEYFDGLAAPQKSWHWFEQSAHAPMIEEPEKFNSLMLSVILPVF